VPKLRRACVEPFVVGVVAVALVLSFRAAWVQVSDHDDRPAEPRVASSAPAVADRTPDDPATPATETRRERHRLNQLIRSRTAALRKNAEGAARRNSSLSATTDFRLVDFNALAASMNNPGRRNANWPKYGYRTSGLWSMMRAHGADIATFQEFQQPQHSTLVSLMGGQYGIYPVSPDRLTPRAIVWRQDRFELISGELMYNAWFGGSERRTPRVLLKDRRTGLEIYVATYHNPPDTQGNQRRWRQAALTSQVASTRRLIAETGRPVIITGDLNDRAPVWAAWRTIPGFSAASGPVNHLVDWILGSSEVTLSDYRIDSSSRARRISDHDMLSVHVHIEQQ